MLGQGATGEIRVMARAGQDVGTEKEDVMEEVEVLNTP
jgi:hypothetical protein